MLDASAVSGGVPPAGPQWLRGLAPLAPNALHDDKPLCVSLFRKDGLEINSLIFNARRR